MPITVPIASWMKLIVAGRISASKWGHRTSYDEMDVPLRIQSRLPRFLRATDAVLLINHKINDGLL